LALLVFVCLAGMPYGTLIPELAERLGGGAALLGELLASAGFGAFLAALTLLTLRRWPIKLDRLVGLGATSMGIGIFWLSQVHSRALAHAPMVLIGFGQILLSSGMLTLLQTLAPSG